LAVAAIVFGIAGLVGAWQLGSKRNPFELLVLAVFGAVVYIAIVLAFRLLSGRERPGGGLFPSWVLYFAGALASSLGAARRTVWGLMVALIA